MTDVRVISLPFGLDSQADGGALLYLSVLFAPVVDPKAPVPETIKRWPDAIARSNGGIAVTIGRRQHQINCAETDRVRRRRTDPLNGPLWAALIGPTPTVAQRRVPVMKSKRTYSIRAMHSAAASAYQKTVPLTGPAKAQSTPALVKAALAASPLKDFRDFHEVARAPAAMHTAAASGVRPQPQRPDVHELISVLSQYPFLQRQLGLIVDLIIPLHPDEVLDLAQWKDDQRCLKCTPSPLTPLGRDVTYISPWTQFAFDAGKAVFFPFSAGSADHDHGFLKLSDSRFGAHAVDVVGAIHQLDNVQSATAANPPGLKSAGLTLFQDERGKTVEARLTRGQQLEQSQSPADETLTVDDLVRGYAIDVHNGEGWFSLCQRSGTYTVGNVPPLSSRPEEDEGFVPPAVAHGADDDSRFHIHETIFSWDGWSLSVPHPSFLRTDVAAASGPSARSASVVDTTFDVVPGSLARLRFADKTAKLASYRFRARSVDLAGNRLRLGGGTAQSADHFFDQSRHKSAQAAYPRYQPAGAPGIYAADDVGDGALNPQTRDVTSLILRDKPATYYIVAPACGLDLWLAHGTIELDATKIVAKLTEVANLAGKPNWGAVIGRGQTPFLTDPIVNAALIANLPSGAGTTAVRIPIDPSKPNVATIVLQPAPDGVTKSTFKVKGSQLTLFLPPGAQFDLQVSSCIDAGSMAVMGIVNDWLGMGDRAIVSALASAGQEPTLCPPKVLHITRAVPRPTRDPALVDGPKGLKPTRDRGSTSVTLSATCSLDAAEAGVIDFEATHTDVDDVTNDVPTDRVVTSTSSQQILAPMPPGLVQMPATVTHNLPDTRARLVSYTPRSTSRFARMYPPGNAMRRGASVPIIIPASAAPAPPRVTRALPTFGWDQSAPNQRRGLGVRIYLARPWFSSGTDEMLAILFPKADTKVGDIVKLPFVTQWGRDPTWQGVPVGASMVLAPKSVTGAVPWSTNLSVALPGGARAEVSAAVVKFAKDANFTKAHGVGEWCCDLAFDLGTEVYWPFIRIALARFQEHAPDELKLSAVVLTDFVQLAPKRTLRVIQGVEGFSVYLSGVFPADKNATLVSVECQQHADDLPIELGWVTVDNASAGPNKDFSEWSLENWRPRGNGTRRLLVTEYQQMANGAGAMASRMVYFDTVAM